MKQKSSEISKDREAWYVRYAEMPLGAIIIARIFSGGNSSPRKPSRCLMNAAQLGAQTLIVDKDIAAPRN